jgi:hypothetical protein
MSSTLLALLSGLVGAILTGVVNHLAMMRAKRADWRLVLEKEKILERQKLYSDFLCSSHKFVMAAADQKISELTKFELIYNEMARIELLATEPVVKAARQICDYVVGVHAQDNVEKRNFFTLKSAFITAARAELDSLSKI